MGRAIALARLYIVILPHAILVRTFSVSVSPHETCSLLEYPETLVDGWGYLGSGGS